MGIRKDYMTKFQFELDTVERHCVMGRFSTSWGTMFIHNFYQPPAGSKYVRMTDIGRLRDVGDWNIAMGGFNWVGAPAMQRLL